MMFWRDSSDSTFLKRRHQSTGDELRYTIKGVNESCTSNSKDCVHKAAVMCEKQKIGFCGGNRE